jgi:hypothetical protein
MLEQIYTSTKTVTAPNWSYVSLAYLKARDALLFHAFGSTSIAYKLFRDGSQVKMLEGLPSINLITREGGRHAWFDATAGTYGKIYAADEITANYHIDTVLNPNCIWPMGTAFANFFIDDQAGLLLMIYTNGRVHRYELSTGAEMLPYLTLATNEIYTHMAWAGTGRVFVGCKSSGRVALVDYQAWQILWQSKVQPCAAMAYDCLHNLIVTVESDGLVRLYITDPVPAQLSAPVFVPDSLTQYRLKGSKVRTQLTGDVGELIPNRVITWSLLNDKGYLENEKTLTDENGEAENFYFGPEVSGVTGAESIKVETGI